MRPYTSKSNTWKFRVTRPDWSSLSIPGSNGKDKTFLQRARPLAKQEMRNANRSMKKSARQIMSKQILEQTEEYENTVGE